MLANYCPDISTVGTPNFVTPGFIPVKEKLPPRKSAVGTNDINQMPKTRNPVIHLTTPGSSDGWAGGIDFKYNP